MSSDTPAIYASLRQTPGEPEFISFGELVRPLREHWLLIVIAAFSAVIAAIAIALVQKPVYQATAELEVQSQSDDLLAGKSLYPTLSDSGLQPYLQTQVKIIESQELLGHVVRKLNLEQSVEYKTNPSWVARWPLIARFLAPNLPGEQQVVRHLLRNLSVRVVDDTQVIEIACRSQDPKRARDLANTIAAEFIDESLARRIQNAENTGRWLTLQLGDLKHNLEQSEDALQEYARQAGLVITPTNDNQAAATNIEQAKLRDVEQALSKAEDERAAAEARYRRVASSPPDSLPDVLDDLTLRDYYVKLTDLRRQAADLGATLAPGHYKVKEVRAQIAVLETALNQRRQNLIERIKTQYQSARAHEQLLSQAYATQAGMVSDAAAKTVRYDVLKHEADTNRSLYEATLQRVKEAGIASAVRTTNVTLIDAGQIPRFPVKPDLRLYALAGLFAGTFIGTALAFRRPRAASVFSGHPDTAVTMTLPQLGAIPDARVSPSALPAVGADSPDLACWSHRDSPVAESIRSSLASILLSSSLVAKPSVLAVTSASSGDGKTILACNFAILLARTGRRVLLVDANLRSPRLHSIFGVPNENGFTSLLCQAGAKSSAPLSRICRSTQIPNLDLLPVGPDPVDSADQLYSRHLSELFDSFRASFDSVVIDTAPLSTADSRPLARLSDGVVLVVRARQAGIDAIGAAQRLIGDGTAVLGAVLNNCGSIA